MIGDDGQLERVNEVPQPKMEQQPQVAKVSERSSKKAKKAIKDPITAEVELNDSFQGEISHKVSSNCIKNHNNDVMLNATSEKLMPEKTVLVVEAVDAQLAPGDSFADIEVVDTDE